MQQLSMIQRAPLKHLLALGGSLNEEEGEKPDLNGHAFPSNKRAQIHRPGSCVTHLGWENGL